MCLPWQDFNLMEANEQKLRNVVTSDRIPYSYTILLVTSSTITLEKFRYVRYFMRASEIKNVSASMRLMSRSPGHGKLI